MMSEPLCECGHRYDEHVPLPGHPDGVEECQADDCDCGQWRPQKWDGVEGTEDYDWRDGIEPGSGRIW